MSAKNVLFVVLSLLCVIGQAEQDPTCGLDSSQITSCISHLTDDDCKKISENHYLTEKFDVCQCCPGCKEYQALNQQCSNPGQKCAPGLKCDGQTCILNKEQCTYVRHLSDNDKKRMIWKPKCRPDSTYDPVQCKGDKETYGRCFCTSAIGKRIFGWMWYKDADKMTCACSRRRHQLEQGGRHDVTLHCSEDGSYEELQCDMEVCWCADVDTGEPKPGVPTVPQSMIKYLPCYNETTIGDRYLRQCESQRYAQEKMRQLLQQRGTNEASLLSIYCDYDGSYAPVQLQKGIAICSAKDKSKIGAWQAESGQSVAKMNCNCARDFALYTENNVEVSLICEANGNYKHLQEHDAHEFCIDGDGYAITELKDLGEAVNCQQELGLYP